jgi:hypothetical protein
MEEFEEVHRTQHEYEAQETAALLRARGILASVSVERSCVTEYVVSVLREDLSCADAILGEDDC